MLLAKPERKYLDEEEDRSDIWAKAKGEVYLLTHSCEVIFFAGSCFHPQPQVCGFYFLSLGQKEKFLQRKPELPDSPYLGSESPGNCSVFSLFLALIVRVFRIFGCMFCCFSCVFAACAGLIRGSAYSILSGMGLGATQI